MKSFRSLAAFLALFPADAFAQTNRFITVNTGIRISFIAVLGKLMNFAVISIVSVATTLFLVGAAFMVGSAGKPELLEKGKKLMKGSLIGLVVTLSAYTILRTAIYFLYITTGY